MKPIERAAALFSKQWAELYHFAPSVLPRLHEHVARAIEAAVRQAALVARRHSLVASAPYVERQILADAGLEPMEEPMSQKVYILSLGLQVFDTLEAAQNSRPGVEWSVGRVTAYNGNRLWTAIVEGEHAFIYERDLRTE